jgi:hypothetical protein
VNAISAEAFTHDVFLSHSAKDKAVVRPLAERLRKDGVKVWFDEWVLKPGDSIPAKIEEGLEHFRVLVLCMSANAFGSDWAQLEAGTFRFRDPLNKERRFIPLRLDDAPIKGSLAQFLYINWLPAIREHEYAKLVQACRNPAAWPSAPNPEAANPAALEHLAALVTARRKEWSRLRKDFESQAKNYHDVKVSVFYVTQEAPPRGGKFPQPHHAISLWQFYGSTEDARERLPAARLTKFGVTGAAVSAFGLITGKQTERFRRIATRAGSLLPDKVSHIVTDLVAERFGDALGPGKPVLVANSNPLAKWLNLVLLATATCHPERFKDSALSADPFAASLTVFDYFRLDE